jgi:hypothetical protein
MSCRDDNNRPLHEKVIAAFQTFDPSLIALADAAEDAQTSALVLVHKEGTKTRLKKEEQFQWQTRKLSNLAAPTNSRRKKRC